MTGLARLAMVEVFTGSMALVGGLLLAIAPDGSLLGADTSDLAGSPFRDWRAPGILLAILVGITFLGVGILQWRAAGWWRLSFAAGAGLIVFEIFEVVWLGLQPLEIVFVVVGASVMAAAVQLRPHPTGSAARLSR